MREVLGANIDDRAGGLQRYIGLDALILIFELVEFLGLRLKVFLEHL